MYCPNCGAPGAELVSSELRFCPVCQSYFCPPAVLQGLDAVQARRRLIRALQEARQAPKRELADCQTTIEAAEDVAQDIAQRARVFRASRLEEIADSIAPVRVQAAALRDTISRMERQLQQLTAGG